ncbi:MAG TPA: RNA polymerase sigma factor SigJ [Solirubrobacterales bacterium]|nr:RNA polymerase sigma factor SigJ [Solirubrobacterales bacterium]
MTEVDWPTRAFEEQRPRLRAVAYRMLGSTAEADDAVQEAWLRLQRVRAEEIEDIGAWLTTVVARIALNMLRSRNTRREQPFEPHMPEPIVDPIDGTDPEHEALVADSVGLALLMVLETLGPAERLAFVLHDMFAVPFDEIAPIVDRSPDAARQLASRARRRLRAADLPAADRAEQRELVEAFLAASREGDFEGLVAVLHPDVVLRADFGPPRGYEEVRGRENALRRARAFARLDLEIRLVQVNGVPGVVTMRPDGTPFSLGSMVVREGRIAEIYFLADPERLARLDLERLRG